MGQEASCCGDTKKTTRSAGKITYGGPKKKHIEKKKGLKASTNSYLSST